MLRTSSAPSGAVPCVETGEPLLSSFISVSFCFCSSSAFLRISSFCCSRRCKRCSKDSWAYAAELIPRVTRTPAANMANRLQHLGIMNHHSFDEETVLFPVNGGRTHLRNEGEG